MSKTSLQREREVKGDMDDAAGTSWITRDLVQWRMAEGIEGQMEWSGGRNCVG